MSQAKKGKAAPENRETPLAEVHSWVTPNRIFFVRNHFDTPELDRSSWRLRLGGGVEREIELTWDDLDAFPQRSVFATLECAGNGRSFLATPVEGVQWGAGAIGHAEWTGVPLRDVLEMAGLHSGTVEIVAEGADSGTDGGASGDEIRFARSLPLEKALHPDTLLALRMNGETLEPNHGYPLRLVVPGWYGVASVKWLTRLEAVSVPFQGHFQTVKYTIKRRTGRGVQTEVVAVMPVKSEIIRPRAGDEVGVGPNRVFGLAWAGEEGVAALELSTDAGVSWRRARLIGPSAPYSWTLWESIWNVTTPGEYALLARAVSEGGQVQPIGYDPLRGGYLINHSRSIPVHVSAARRSRDLPGHAQSLLREMNAFAEERARLPLDLEMELTHGGGI